MEWEIWATISEEELRVLKESPLTGIIRRHSHSQEGEHSQIPLRIERGATSEHNVVDLTTFPNRAYWEDAKDYKITLSDQAYEELDKNKRTGERLYNNPGCKILIRVE